MLLVEHTGIQSLFLQSIHTLALFGGAAEKQQISNRKYGQQENHRDQRTVTDHRSHRHPESALARIIGITPMEAAAEVRKIGRIRRLAECQMASRTCISFRFTQFLCIIDHDNSVTDNDSHQTDNTQYTGNTEFHSLNQNTRSRTEQAKSHAQEDQRCDIDPMEMKHQNKRKS